MVEKLKPVRAWAWVQPGCPLTGAAIYRTRRAAIDDIGRASGYPWEQLRRWGHRLVRVTITPESTDA